MVSELAEHLNNAGYYNDKKWWQWIVDDYLQCIARSIFLND